MRVEITGLQIASPDERSVIIQGRPLRVQLELVSHFDEPVEAQAKVEFCEAHGEPRLHCSAPLTVPVGRSWFEMRLPPDSLPLGRHSLSVNVQGHDYHRTRRLVDVLEVPLGLPPHEAEQWEVWQQQEGELPRDARIWRVEQVRVRSGGTEPVVFPSGAPVEIIARLDRDGLKPNILVRIQIFSLRGELVFGTNTKRWGLSLNAAGRWTLRADIDALNLAPGQYLITVGFWQDEGSFEPIQARHGYHEIFVGAPGRPWLASEVESAEDEGEGEDEGEEPEWVELVGDGSVARGEWAELKLRGEGIFIARAWLERDGIHMGQARTPALVCTGPSRWSWKLRALLPPGEYTLSCTWSRPGEAELDTPTRLALVITDEQEKDEVRA